MQILVGQYQAMMLRTGSHRWFETVCDGLESLMERYPKKRKPSDFDRMDIEDWQAELRLTAKSPGVLRKWRQGCSSFFRWLAKTKPAYYTLANPASSRRFQL